MPEPRVTAEQIHQRILLVGGTALLAVSASHRWVEEGTHIHTGWNLMWSVGASSEGEGSTFAAASPYLAFWVLLALAALVGAVLLPPTEVAGIVGKVLGSVAAVLSLFLAVMAASAGRSDDLEVRSGLIVSAVLSFGVSVLWFHAAEAPWPAANASDVRPTPGARDSRPTPGARDY